MLNRLAVFTISLYRNFLSPFLGDRCRFYPSCSVYSKESFLKYNFTKASWLSVKRLAKCHPFCEGGHDPLL